jgi:outer membrane protein OmpA-like peptidoglycan-associated protein
MGAGNVNRLAAIGLALFAVAACGDHDRDKAGHAQKTGQQQTAGAPATENKAAGTGGSSGPGETDVSKKAIFYSEVAPADRLASNLMGLDVYNLEGEKIGTINDLVLGEDKSLHGIVVSAGGLLGVGDRRVAVRPGSLLVTRDENGNLRAVANTHRNDLSKAPVFRFPDEGRAEVSAEAPEAAPPSQSDEAVTNVFFDFNRADLTPDARAVLDRVAERIGPARVIVGGHTDTSGSSAYNQRLSERRAQAVKRYLVHKGIPAKRIRTKAFGENGLLIETGDGVREPQNRRATIQVPESQAAPVGETEVRRPKGPESDRRIGPNAGS